MTRAILEAALQAHLSGDLSQAKNLYLKAITNKTNDPAAYANLGFILKEEGQLEEAIAQTEKALSIDPNNDLFLANAGGIHLQMSNYKLAIELSIKAIQANPSNSLALANLGTAYRITGELDAAKSALTKSLLLQPNNPITILTLGGINLETNELEEAMKAALSAISIDPTCSKAHTLLGKIDQVKGNLEDAKKHFKQALRLNPNEAEAISSLSIDIHESREAEDLLKTALLCNQASQSKADQAFLHYAYANCHHKLCNYEIAAEHLRQAHCNKAAFAPSEADQLIKEIHHFKARSQSKPSNQNPTDSHKSIFIVGMPRSGSTLLESILSINKMVNDLGESRAMAVAISQFISPENNRSQNSFSLEELYRTATNNRTTNKSHTLDKQLYNFKYAGLIASQLPNCKIIHCKRHPLDNILSISRSNLARGNNYGANPIDSARVLIEQEKAMNFYKNGNDEQFYTFNYDSFVTQPRNDLEPLLEWLNFQWEEQYLHPHKNNRNIITASVIQARKPISNKSLGGWKKYKLFLEPARTEIVASGLFNDFDLSPN